MAGVGNDPVEAGLIESLARPGGNVTGLTNLTGKLAGKRLELFKEAVPKLTRVAVLYQPATPANVIEVKEDLPNAARALKLTVQPWEVRSAEGFDGVFAALNKQRPDGLYVAGSPVTNANQKRIASFALKSRLPSVYGDGGFCRRGWAHVLWGGPRGQLPARRILRRQDPERSQAGRPPCRTADEV